MCDSSHTDQLRDTQDAFDSVAADYDGPRGNNALIQEMREEMWRWLDATFPTAGRLLDLGCGTGLDAIRMAQHGHQVTATDWSGEMVARTRDRTSDHKLNGHVEALAVGAHELDRLPATPLYDGIYSNLGPLNCVPDIANVAHECARLLKPDGALVFTVIGRVCPWEIVHYAVRGRWSRLAVRFARGVTPVGMNGRTVWTRYYTPREFFRPFAHEFALEHLRGLCIFAPPPYLSAVRERFPRCHAALRSLDRHLADWPLVRGAGDHFLVIMRKR